MPFQPVLNCVEIIVAATCGGQEMINTFYAKKGGAYNLSDLAGLAAVVDAWVVASFRPLHASNWHYDRTTVRGLNESIDLEVTDSSGAGYGARADASMPNNVALAVKRASAFTGRGARGRIFVGGIAPSDLVETNTIRDAYVTSLEAALNALRTVIAGVDWTEVIVHRVAAGTPLPIAIAFTVLEYVIVDKTLDSMRRRLPGRGV